MVNQKPFYFLLLLITGGVLYFLFDLSNQLTFENLYQESEALNQFYKQNKWVVTISFLICYIGIIIFFIPGMFFLTLFAGWIFGPIWGTFWVSLGALSGALLGFWMARFLIRDWVLKRFHREFKSFETGVLRNEICFLLFLRFVPILPYPLINSLAGISQLSLSSFFWGTLIGDLPLNYIIVNAASRLSSIESSRDIFSFEIILALFLLGTLSLAPFFYNILKKSGHKNSNFL